MITTGIAQRWPEDDPGMTRGSPGDDPGMTRGSHGDDPGTTWGSFPDNIRTIPGHPRTSPDIPDNLRTSPDISGHLRTISGHLRTSPDISGHLRTSPDISGHLRTSLTTFESTMRFGQALASMTDATDHVGKRWCGPLRAHPHRIVTTSVASVMEEKRLEKRLGGDRIPQ
jgi:hypothetical protein